MQSIGLTTMADVEVISAYTATNQTIPAVAAAPGWYVVGVMFLRTSVQDARLEIIGAVTDVSLEMNVRLFDMEAAAPVSGSDAKIVGSVLDARSVSGLFALIGQRKYQFLAQVVGGVSSSLFGNLKSATLI